MRVFLTGASGYVGRHVALELLRPRVTGLARQPSVGPILPRSNGGVSLICATLRPTGQRVEADAVVHCAMGYSPAGEDTGWIATLSISCRTFRVASSPRAACLPSSFDEVA
jgi:nucleoside-diphosphate-sugar epimerase